MPHRPWHIDHGYDFPRDAIWGVNIFLFVDDVQPQGGGTLVLHGSPRIMRAFVDGLRPATRTQKQLRHAFDASDPYLKALSDPSDTVDRVARFVDRDTDVHGVPTLRGAAVRLERAMSSCAIRGPCTTWRPTRATDRV